MASSYGPLSLWYDTLTGDIPYGEFADFYEARFNIDGGEFKTLLDLCCGTGTLTSAHGAPRIRNDRRRCVGGYAHAGLRQGIGRRNARRCICVRTHASLIFTARWTRRYCSLDGINYISPDKLGRVFDRLHLFVRPYGLFIFDIKTPESFRALDGEIFVDETDDVLCLWRADFSEEDNTLLVRNGSVLPARQAVAARMRGARRIRPLARGAQSACSKDRALSRSSFSPTVRRATGAECSYRQKTQAFIEVTQWTGFSEQQPATAL